MNSKELRAEQLPRDTAVGLGGFALGLTIACLITHLPGSSSEWASWVQAVGSIFAIAGAFLVARYQAQHQMTQLLRSSAQARVIEAELAFVVATDAVAAITVANQYIANFVNGSVFKFDLDRLSDVQLSLRTLYGRGVPPDVLSSVIDIQRFVTYSVRAIQQRNENSGATYLKREFRDRARSRVKSANEASRKIEHWLSGERAKLGLKPANSFREADG